MSIIKQKNERRVLTALDNILYFYDEAVVAKRFDLTRDEFLFLYGMSKGCKFHDLMDYLDQKRSTLYCVRQKVIQKFGVSTFEQVMYSYGQLNSDKHK